MTNTAADAEREVEASRGDLDRTIEALKEKMTPGQLWDEATRSMGGAGNELLGRIGEQAKTNPFPLALIGLGLAWLMSGQSHVPPSQRQPGRVSDPTMDSISNKPSFADRALGFASTASENVGAATARVADAATDTIDAARGRGAQVSSAAADTAERAKQYGEKTRQTATDLLDREPLLIGGAAFLVGLAVGAAAPATDIEKRYIAPMGDQLMRKGQEVAEVGLDKAKDATQSAFGAAKKSVLENGEEAPAS